MGYAALSYLTLLGGILLYGGATALFFLGVARSSATARASLAGEVVAKETRPAPLMLAAAAVLHFTYICAASFVAKVCPINSVHFILSVTAVLATVFYLAARWIGARSSAKEGDRDAPPPAPANRTSRENLDALGLVIAPLGLAFLLGTYFLAKPVSGPVLGSGFLALHVLVNLVGIALFVLAGASATLYLVQEKRLKTKRLGKIKNLPPLDTLDRAEHRFLIAGFPLLTIGILTGTFWSRQLEFGTTTEIMRIVFGYATWLLIAAVLLLRSAAGWRGRRSAYGTILGLICALGVLVVYLTRPSVPSSGASVEIEPRSIAGVDAPGVRGAP